MPADPKSPPRTKNPELLAELHDLWAEFGCAICGRPTDPTPPDGFAVELHHVIPRGQGGPDAPWNIVGLCGGLTENRCHQRVTEHEYEITRNEQGYLVWRDRRAGGLLWQAIRFIPAYSQLVPNGSPAGSSAETPGTVDPPPAEADRDTAPIAADPPQDGASLALEPAGDAPPSPDDPPELRASQIRDRVTASKRLMMEAAILLQNASERQDHVKLGVSWADYYASLGLERATVSRMLTAARTLGDEWMGLSTAAREHVGLESAYQGALLVTREGWSASDAMDAVVSTPTAHLIALRTGDEPADRCMCTCPKCGREAWHTRG